MKNINGEERRTNGNSERNYKKKKYKMKIITTIIIIIIPGGSIVNVRIPNRNPQSRQHCAWLTDRDCRRGGRAAQRKNVLNEGFNTKDDAILCFLRYV